ncbi:hypothetical protein BD289DRAFT_482107 [Coniella lustricola]|uniref:Rhodopsin domain-containing protein n=1 Tax=Coniella lustricola TaxID=2025994 RepID=A0A2T3A9Z4_9PEZI|nr:hypothetical protein BD289DRAFT_482107 [Coniella lustricola]
MGCVNHFNDNINVPDVLEASCKPETVKEAPDCCIAAWLLSAAYSIIVMTCTSTARHIWDVPLSAVNASWIKRSAVLGTIYGPAMWLAKTAILTMYLRLFGVKAWMRWCCYGGIIFLACAYWSLVPVSAVYNFPHGDEKWDLATDEKAAPAQSAFMVMGLIGVISDVYILILPWPILMTLHTSLRRKLALGVVFLTAIVGIASSCVVFALRVVLWRAKTEDSTWNVAASYLTTAVEMNVAVIVSCAPAAAAWWKHAVQESQWFSSLRSVFRTSKTHTLDTSASKSNLKSADPEPETGSNLNADCISLKSLQQESFPR